VPFVERNDLFTKLETFLLQLVEGEHLWMPRKKAAIDFLSEEHSKFSQISANVFDHLVSLVDTDPQLVIDFAREALSSENFTTFASLAKADTKKLRDEIDFIAVFWELSSVFKLAAYLLSRKSVRLSGLGDTKAILKYFRPFGILRTDIDQMRQIRNARYHRFTIRKGKLITNSETSPKEIDKTEIAALSEKLENLCSWYFRFVLGAALCIPKFGFLLIYTIFESANRDVDALRSYIEELETDLLPRSALHPTKRAPWNDRFRDAWRKLRFKNPLGLFKKDPLAEFFSEHRQLLTEKAKEHSKDVASELCHISDQLVNPKDKEMLVWLSKYAITFGELLNSRKS